MHVLMVAAENGSLPGGKVGGIGDVIRDVPPALARRGHQVTVVTPGYGFLSRLPGAQLQATLAVGFGEALHEVQLFSVDAGGSAGGSAGESTFVRTLLLEHPLFCPDGEPRIYHHDRYEPFATDARTFALFCQAVCQALVAGAIPMPDVVHLHDWHTALVLPLSMSHPGYRALRGVHSVFSIHNLSLQGIRPLRDNWSSPAAWFPGLRLPLPDVRDPRYADCINLMRSGIRLADRVHVVSPGYAREILLPSEPALGLVRGEGLEGDLQAAQAQGRLLGILNGCDYDHVRRRAPTHRQFLQAAQAALDAWVDGKLQVSGAHYRAQQRIHHWQWQNRKPPMVVGLVGRLTDQKFGLLQVVMSDGCSALDHLLGALEGAPMLLLGSGEAAHERFFLDAMLAHDNFLFLNGYSEDMADALYRYCDLFLMPSSFEPCGISQLLAMRAGTPCLVHGTGGLADTVSHLETGFVFVGDSPREQAAAMLVVFEQALQLRREKPLQWKEMVQKARSARFTWEQAVRDYERLLY